MFPVCEKCGTALCYDEKLGQSYCPKCLRCPICRATSSTSGRPFSERTLKLHIGMHKISGVPGWNKRGGLKV